MSRFSFERHAAHPLRISGPLIEAALGRVVIGEMCEVRRHWRDRQSCAWAQVIGFKADAVVLSLLGNASGLSRASLIVPTGGSLRMSCGPQLLGSVVDPHGAIIERLAPASGFTCEDYPVDAPPPDYRQRRPVKIPLVSGIRVIDGLLTCGIGQRMGIFAAAGSGKTSLIDMLIARSEADVFVIALVGERGREVTEFIESLRGSIKRSRCVVVFATSDFSSIDRCNTALQATAIAEYFRDQGQQVMLFMDSITRYARARRDLALAAGEPPARRGYPSSVFDALPALLERPGVTERGSITAFYTVLLESDDEPDPLAEEIRSILDGHIHLSRALAGKGHFPAVDVLRSVSRVARQVADPATQVLAIKAREIMSRLEDLQVLLDMGEYSPGVNAANDHAMSCRDALDDWLRQSTDEGSDPRDAMERLHDLIG
ncbi:type III secretion system ATPase SctN [Pseudomonas sp. NPDC090202]|uniref:type III secretion system ATPase SctN n=1 Tax=unclassified Pseudomonas TaxID=196821 RepID=UPI003812B305